MLYFIIITISPILTENGFVHHVTIINSWLTPSETHSKTRHNTARTTKHCYNNKQFKY